MFKFVFDVITEPLGLPIEWYQEWIILGIIGAIAYLIAYDKVGNLYRDHMISGHMAGSFFHWIIRTILFTAIWAMAYGVIWLGKFVIENIVLVGIIGGIVLLVVLAVRLLLWKRKCKVMVMVEVQNEKTRIGKYQ